MSKILPIWLNKNYKKNLSHNYTLQILSAFVVIIFHFLLGPSALGQSAQCISLFNSAEANAQTSSSDFTPSTNIKTAWESGHLKVRTFNAKDFYYRKKNPQSNPLIKTREQVKAIADLIFKDQPDIIVLNEVGGRSAIEALFDISNNRDYFQVFTGSTQHQHLETFSHNNVLLVKRSLQLKIQIERFFLNDINPEYLPSLKNFGLNRSVLFDRGLPTVSFRDPETNRPLFVVIAIHANIIPKLFDQAQKELLRDLEQKAIKEHIENLQQTHGFDLPIILAGDFNQNLASANVLTQLREIMSESFDALNVPYQSPGRSTHQMTILDSRTQKPVTLSRQVDGIFVSQHNKGSVVGIKKTSNPHISDHASLLVTFNLPPRR